MKKILWVCSLLLVTALLIAGQTNLLNNGKDDADPATPLSAGATIMPAPDGAAYEAIKERYYYLVDRVTNGSATEMEITELREACFSWNLELPIALVDQEPEAPGRDPNPLDQGGVDTTANCASAAVIGSLPYTDSGNFDGDNDCSVVSASPYNEVFYTFTPSVTGNYQFRARSYTTGVAAIRVMSGGCCAGATSVAFSASSVATDCGEPSTVVTYMRATLTAGTQYWIHVGTSSATVSTLGYDFFMNYVPCPPEESGDNNSMAMAQVIACGDSVLGDSAYTTAPSTPDWYQLTLAEAESLRVFVGGRALGHCNSGLYPGGTSVDGRFTLYNSNGDSIGYDNDSGCSFDAVKAFCLPAGTYYIKVWNTSVLEYVMTTSCGPACSPPVPPANDLCVNAIPLAIPSQTETGNNELTATDATGTCVSSAPYAGIWYTVVGNGNLLTATTCNDFGTLYDTRLQVFTGTCDALVCVTGNDDDTQCTANTPTPTYHSTARWCSDVGVTYYIHVGSYSSTGRGTFRLDILDGDNCHIDCATYPPCGTPAEVEPNDSCFWAANFVDLNCGADGQPAYYYGTICPQADVDYYHIPGVPLGQVVLVKLYEGENCDVYPPAGLRMRGATGADGTCAAATGTATTNYVLGTNCTPFTGGYIGVVRNTLFENKYKIEVRCSTAVLPVCPDVVLPNQFCAGPCVGPITDNTAYNYTQDVSLNEIIDDLNVRVNIQHTYDGDIDMWLITPWNDTLELTTDNGGSGDNYMVTVFDDEGANGPVTAGVAPFNGSYIPEELLAGADGYNAQGTWTLRVADDAGGDIGYVNCWCLEFESHSPCTPTELVSFTRYPIPQAACATLCLESTTLIRICQDGPFIPGLPPIVNVTPGCATEFCNETCDPAMFTYDPMLWMINPANGCWENTIIGLSGGCVCVTLEGFLAVDLNSFAATAGDRRVTLTWSTASETNHDYFEVLRDGVKMTEVAGRGSVNAGSTYNWTDTGLNNGTVYHYSLVAVDNNGNRGEIAAANAVPVPSVVVTEYSLHQNYPNPFNPATSITFDLVEAGFVSLKVYNVVGQEVAVLVNGMENAGRHVVSFDATGLPSGLYLYRIEANGFVTQKKMLLMK